MESSYLKKLLKENPRYLMKLKFIKDLDPFTFACADLDYSVGGIPPVTYPDIFAYIVLTHSFYTHEQMKAYKTLDAHKYVSAGLVLKVGTKIINDFYVMVGKVKHSTKASAKPLEVWCIITEDGSVSSGHCTCMAGNNEVSSHSGALLFVAEYANRNKGIVSCTDVALWPMPSLSTIVPIVPIAEMDFGTMADPIQHNIAIPTMSKDGIVNLLRRVESLNRTASIMRIVEPYASTLQAASAITLPVIFNIFEERYIYKNYVELMDISKPIDMSLTTVQTSLIEEHTQGQHTSNNWYLQRAGRVTASKLKSVCRTNKKSPSLSLIKGICYQAKALFRTKATDWGFVVIEQYKKIMEDNHEDFIINDVGLVINSRWPQLGAYPDRLVFCEFCLGGVLEVKCPYLLYTNSIKDIKEYSKFNNSCVILRNGKITLNCDHSYYYQVQMQMFVCNLQYCDFVIWSPFIFFKERVFPDFHFWEQHSRTALKIHAEVIMPDLLGRYFIRSEGSVKLNYWCKCRSVDDGTPMKSCDNEECEIKWFHFKCVGLLDTPKSQWLCEFCK